MRSHCIKTSLLASLTAALLIAGCAMLSDIAGPGQASEIAIVERGFDGYTVARETDPAVGVVTAIVDGEGGSLNIGDHVLTVPAGAVSAPTTFVMTRLVDDIEVGLTATHLLPNDVGSRGFAVPVKLSLSYANAAEVPANRNAIKVGWVKANGSIEVQQSRVDLGREVVVGSLNHFSAYAIVTAE